MYRYCQSRFSQVLIAFFIAVLVLVSISGCREGLQQEDARQEQAEDVRQVTEEPFEEDIIPEGPVDEELVVREPEYAADDGDDVIDEPDVSGQVEETVEPFCGDGECQSGRGEDCDSCYVDCACDSPAECHRGECVIPECGSDGDCDDDDPCTEDVCYFAQHVNAYCGHDDIERCRDGDGCCPSGCNADDDDDCDPVCGNDVCETGETEDGCPEDCGPECGDGICEGDEDADSCPEDCGPVCGDGICEDGEDMTSCQEDCL